MNTNSNEWDELDFLFNRAKLRNIDINTSLRERILIMSELRNIFLSNNINFYLDEPTNNLIKNKKQENILEDKIVVQSKNTEKIKNLFFNSEFKIVKSDSKNIYLNKNSRIFLIETQKERFNFEELQNIIFNNKEYTIKIISSPRKRKQFNLKNKLRLFLMNNFSRKISEEKFLSLEIESKNSKSWILRKKHLDLVTDSTKNRKVKDIVDYFSDENLFNKIQKQIIETPASEVFEEPIYANKNFWMSGNNFFVFPIIFKFKKNVTPYKEANSYIERVGTPNIYSNEYYKGLDDMSDNEIRIFLKNNPIEISNNCIVSGKHRAFAMIGRLVDNQKYIPFYAKFI